VRILVCSIEAPLPPVNGLRLALGELLEQLRRRHHVRTLALTGADQRAADADDATLRLLPPAQPSAVRATGRHLRALLARRPFGVDRLSEALREPLLEELERFRPDVVHVTSGRAAALGRALAGRPAVLAALDAWHLNVEADAAAAPAWRRPLLAMQAGLVRRFEARVYRFFSRVVVVSEADRDALLALDPSLRIAVIPNGVDTDFFAPASDTARDEQRLLFTGVMSYPPNVTAAEFLARELAPLVRAARPAARLAIVGRAPAPAVRDLSRLEAVDVVGEVPDLRPWLTGSRVYVCPMQSGTGIKNKLLEAMASGLPCVATPLALQGLQARDGVELLVGETPEELASHVVRLLEDDELAQTLGNAARRYVCAQHDWTAVGAAYERLYETVRAERPSSS
jgi:polysaccharide biosynthesis protein PslH